LAVAAACAVPSRSDNSNPGSETAGSKQSSIERGDNINRSDSPESSQFPRSTVRLATKGKDPKTGEDVTGYCTGVIISPTQIITAAHCELNATTTVGLYPTAPGTGVFPIQPLLATTGATFSYPPGVTCYPPNNVCIPLYYTCPGGAHCNATNGTFADIAIITLANPIGAPYVAAPLGAAGSFDTTYDRFSVWAVGTGMINVFASGGHFTYDDAGVVNGIWTDPDNSTLANDDGAMSWVPVVLWQPPNGNNDDKGFFTGLEIYADPGDSGGPLYQFYNRPGDYKLILVGVLHGMDDSFQHSQWTSVENQVIHDWITSVLKPGPPGGTAGVASFGAAQ
jgi:hypothetical protein